MPEKDKKNPAHTTSTASTNTTSTTTSITMSVSTFFPKKSHSKRTKQSIQITIPKRHPSTHSSFIASDIRLKHHKKSPHSFAHHRTSFTTHPATNSTSSSTSTKKTSANTKICLKQKLKQL